MKLMRLSRYYYLRFAKLKGEPKSLAMGTAIGVFIGLSPTIPLHTILILALTMTTRTSAIAGILSSWVICNPLTYVPIYYFSMVIGNNITPYNLSWQRIKSLLDGFSSGQSFTESLSAVTSLGLEAIVVMITGGFVLALPFTIASYRFSFTFFQRRQKKNATFRKSS